MASDKRITRELGIYSGDQRVGDLSFNLRKGTWDGEEEAVELTETVRLRISFRGERFSIRSDQTAWVNDDLRLLASSGVIDFGAGRWETRTVHIGGERYVRTQSTSGGQARDTLTVPAGVLVSDVLPLYLHRDPGEEGRRRELTVFNMNLGQEVPFTSTYGGTTRDGRLFTVTYWGMEEKIWLDAGGIVTREEMALGVQARLPVAGESGGHLALETILTRTAVPSAGIPADIGKLKEVLLALEGSFRTPHHGRWQDVEREEERALVRLSRPELPLPVERKLVSAMMPQDDFALDLDSTKIRNLAMEITGRVSDPWEKALAVGLWVNARLGKSMKECFSALQVLEVGEGECQSHSLLTVALCRAAGVPARFAYGVVYMPAQGSFLFHTWVEVHVGEWIPIDPTLGDFPAGVDHLTLVVGGYRDQFRLFPFIMNGRGWRISLVDAP
jgi:hypothetical protein